MATDQPDRNTILELLARLHAQKTVGYGNAWRKRGELLSIFTNLARKYDRLVVALDDRVASNDEALLDTAADLCVYAGKYLTWIADCRPDAFALAPEGAEARRCSDAAGPEALQEVFAHLQDSAMEAPLSVPSAWQRVKSVFEVLEGGLLAQAGAGNGPSLSWTEKTTLAWGLTAATAALTLAVANEHPDELAAFQGQVVAMEDSTADE
jgi:hypothetical protein